MAFELTEWQKEAARAYGGGDFAYIADQTYASHEAFKADLVGMSDSLFQFIMIELGANEDCDDVVEAANRMGAALSEIQSVISAIENMPEPATPAT